MRLPAVFNAKNIKEVNDILRDIVAFLTQADNSITRGTVATVSGVAKTIYDTSTSAGLFEIYARTDVANYHAVARFSHTPVFSGFLDNISGSANFALSNVGGTIKVTQSSGAARNIEFVIRHLE